MLSFIKECLSNITSFFNLLNSFVFITAACIIVVYVCMKSEFNFKYHCYKSKDSFDIKVTK